MTGENTPQTSTVDRALMEQDLQRLIELMTKVLLAHLERLQHLRVRVGLWKLRRTIDVGQILYRLASQPLPSRISSVGAPLRTLTDDEITAMCAVIATELAAWCRMGPPLTPEQISAAAPAFAELFLPPADAPYWAGEPIDAEELWRILFQGAEPTAS
jgi:hypothetical protein